MQKRSAVIPQAMTENHPWQQRLRLLGLTQRDLAQLAGHAETVVSKQLRGHLQKGVPQYIIALILAWEVMTDQQRTKWRAAIEREVTGSPARRRPKEAAADPTAENAALRRQVAELTRRLREQTGRKR